MQVIVFMHDLVYIDPYPVEFKSGTITRISVGSLALDAVIWTEINDKSSGESRTRSDCTYVQADLALYFPQNKSVATDALDKDSLTEYRLVLYCVCMSFYPVQGKLHASPKLSAQVSLNNPRRVMCM